MKPMIPPPPFDSGTTNTFPSVATVGTLDAGVQSGHFGHAGQTQAGQDTETGPAVTLCSS